MNVYGREVMEILLKLVIRFLQYDLFWQNENSYLFEMIPIFIEKIKCFKILRYNYIIKYYYKISAMH